MKNPKIKAPRFVRHEIAKALLNDANGIIRKSAAEQIIKAGLGVIMRSTNTIDSFECYEVYEEVKKAEEFLSFDARASVDKAAFGALYDFDKDVRKAVIARALQLGGLKTLRGGVIKDAEHLTRKGLREVKKSRNPKKERDKYAELLEAMRPAFISTRNFVQVRQKFEAQAKEIIDKKRKR